MSWWSKVKGRLRPEGREAMVDPDPSPSVSWGEARFGPHTVTPPQGWGWRNAEEGIGIVFYLDDGEVCDGFEPIIMVLALEEGSESRRAEAIEHMWRETSPEDQISRHSVELPQGATVETFVYHRRGDDNLGGDGLVVSYSLVRCPGSGTVLVAAPYLLEQQEKVEAPLEAVLESLLLDDRFELPKEGAIRLGPVEKIKVSRWLEESRREHFQAVLMAWKQIRNDPKSEVEVEPLVSDPPRRRADLLRVRGEEAEGLTIQIGGREARETLCRFTLPSGVSVDMVSPFDWSRVAVSVEGGPADWWTFHKWSDRWLQEGARPVRVSRELVLGGVLHSVSEPRQLAGAGIPWIEIDFGSAPVEAFWELVEVFTAEGARHLVFTSASPVEEPAVYEPLSPAAFVGEAEALLRGLYPGVELESQDEMALVLGFPDFRMRLDLTRAIEEQRGEPWNRPAILGRACAAVRYHLQAAAEPAVIIPLVRTHAFTSEREEADGRALFRRDLWAGLVLVYARDLPTSLSFPSKEELIGLGVDLDTLWETALENLARILPPVAAVDLSDGIYTLRAGGNFEASLLFLPRFWPAGLEGDVVAAVPSRDVILLMSASSNKGLDEIRRLAREGFERGGSSALSPDLLIRRDGQWEVLTEAD